MTARNIQSHWHNCTLYPQLLVFESTMSQFVSAMMNAWFNAPLAIFQLYSTCVYASIFIDVSRWSAMVISRHIFLNPCTPHRATGSQMFYIKYTCLLEKMLNQKPQFHFVNEMKSSKYKLQIYIFVHSFQSFLY